MLRILRLLTFGACLHCALALPAAAVVSSDGDVAYRNTSTAGLSATVRY